MAGTRRASVRRVGRIASGAAFAVAALVADANQVADPWTFRLDQPQQARVRFGVPYVGFGLAALGRRDVRMAIIALQALLIGAFNLAGLWRRLGALEAAA
jgi:hypothetical protein